MSLLTENVAEVSASEVLVGTLNVVLFEGLTLPLSSGSFNQIVGLATPVPGEEFTVFYDVYTGQPLQLPSDYMLGRIYLKSEVPLVSQDSSNVGFDLLLSKSGTNTNDTSSLKSPYMNSINTRLAYYFTSDPGNVTGYNYLWLQNTSNPFVSIVSGVVKIIVLYK